MKINNIKKIDYIGNVYNLRIKSEDGLNHNYFANNLNVSNCHKAKSQSIKDILAKCKNAHYKFGLSGTLPKDGTLDKLTLMSQTGPVITEVKAAFLQKEGHIAGCKVKIIEMDYAPESTKIAFQELAQNRYESKDVFQLEQNYVVNNQARLDFVVSVISKIPRNSLVLFHRIEHGKKIYDALRQNSDKKVYYVDGSTDTDIREEHKKKMENSQDDHTIIEFGEKTIKVLQYTKVPLSDGTIKIAKDITLDDDIDDQWIIQKIKER